MTPFPLLWLPILLSGIFVFIASSLIHMLLPWHRSDYGRVPDEEKFMDAVRPLAVPAGDYMVPSPCGGRDEMRSAEFKEKIKKGPVLMMTVMPANWMSMGRNMGLWFLYVLVVSFVAAYVAGRALPPHSDYLEIFRFAGVAAFLTYTGALWPMSIWYRRAWTTTIKSTIDGLIYAGITAATFGWLWPN